MASNFCLTQLAANAFVRRRRTRRSREVYCKVGQARIPIQVDIGFGDAVTPAPAVADFPTLLDFPAPHLKVYPKETVVAEKFEAMVKQAR